MRTVTLQSILLRAWQRSGNDGSDISNIPTGSRTMMVAAATDRIAECWQWADWPELCRVEERTVQGNETTGFFIDYVQVGETPMGEVFAVYRDSPVTHVAPREIPYTLLGDAIRFPESRELPPTVFVRYRLRPETYTASNLTATVPAVLSKAVAYLLTGDLLEEDGQLDKALLMEQKAESELISQRDKYVFQQNQTTRWSASMNHY
jgi:hypothetical protein